MTSFGVTFSVPLKHLSLEFQGKKRWCIFLSLLSGDAGFHLPLTLKLTLVVSLKFVYHKVPSFSLYFEGKPWKLLNCTHYILTNTIAFIYIYWMSYYKLGTKWYFLNVIILPKFISLCCIVRKIFSSPCLLNFCCFYNVARNSVDLNLGYN